MKKQNDGHGISKESKQDIDYEAKFRNTHKELEELKRKYEELKDDNLKLQNQLFEVKCYNAQKESNSNALQENDKNLINILKNEFDEKLTKYEKLTEKKLRQLNSKESSTSEDFRQMMNGDFKDVDFERELSKSQKPSKTLFMCINENSKLKQVNFFLEKENEALKKEISNLNVKCEKFDEKVSVAHRQVAELEFKLKEKEN